MRFLILGCAVLALSAAPALAVENFIPLGQNYAPGDDTLPPIGSEQDRVNAQVDIYETEIYGRAAARKAVREPAQPAEPAGARRAGRQFPRLLSIAQTAGC